MDGPVVVGFDGSPESLAATGWAAREALGWRLPLELVQAWPWRRPHVLGSDDAERWGGRRPAGQEALFMAFTAAGSMAGVAAVEHRALADALGPGRERYPQVDVVEQLTPGSAARTLVEAAAQAGLLVVGRRTRRPAMGPSLGPVAQAATQHASCPVVVVPHH
ncbi:universal stress protein [Kitasatospora sp. NBC_00240]|uniref:universal stress protein n=1 Tax=Kitasatospora sp. NBC_00240 TaxID=2903567 RepID=UPI0022531DC4|nr:universal stress protein [Kitasatospora sp. NBC_00240]MCX5208271.1 universal stress protein [Kitasatospora sp. NBC_00240]